MAEKTSFQRQSKVFRTVWISRPVQAWLDDLLLRPRSWKAGVVLDVLPQLKGASRERWKSLGNKGKSVTKVQKSKPSERGKEQAQCAEHSTQTSTQDGAQASAPVSTNPSTTCGRSKAGFRARDGPLSLPSEHCFTTFCSSPLLFALTSPSSKKSKSS